MAKKQMRVKFDLTDGTIKPRYIDGEQLPDWENGPAMDDYVRQLNDAGWQLAERLSANTYVFERDEP